jgi:two-component system, chemotaxis family, protein-glutamate methylesterase/glutaminase
MRGCELVVIGASWGGLQAISRLLADLPGDFPVPVLVVQHRAEDAGDVLAGLLDRAGPLPVREAEDKEPLPFEGVLVAPPGYHVLVERHGLALSTDAHVRFSRPSIDVALETAADALGAGVVGVVLTGEGDDGAAGLAAVRRRGGIAVVEDPASATRPTMPSAAMAAARPQTVAELSEIAPLLVRLARGGEPVR